MEAGRQHRDQAVSCANKTRATSTTHSELPQTTPLHRCHSQWRSRRPHRPTGARPYNAILLISFALMAAAGAWFMSINTYLSDTPLGFSDVMGAGEHPNGLRIKKHYTDLPFLDEWLSFLVSAFIPGTGGLNEAWYWQQMHFLIQLTPTIATINFEAVHNAGVRTACETNTDCVHQRLVLGKE
jgi:hypothetical protein